MDLRNPRLVGAVGVRMEKLMLTMGAQHDLEPPIALAIELYGYPECT